MADIFCDDGGSSTAPYETWAKAATTYLVAVDAAADGDTEYRCVYVKNTHPLLSAVDTIASIKTDPAKSDFEIALGESGLSGTESEIPDEDTAP